MNKLIMTVFTVALLAAGSTANAASCKYTVDEVDLFTNVKLVATKWYSMTSAMSSAFKILVDNRTSVSVAAMAEGESNFIAIKLRLNDGVGSEPSNEELRDALLVEKGAQLMITLADESELVLYARKTVKGITRYGTSGGTPVVESNIVVLYPVEADDIEALLNQDVSFVSLAATNSRFTFADSDGHISFKMNRKGRGRFTEALACLEKA